MNNYEQNCEFYDAVLGHFVLRGGFVRNSGFPANFGTC